MQRHEDNTQLPGTAGDLPASSLSTIRYSLQGVVVVDLQCYQNKVPIDNRGWL